MTAPGHGGAPDADDVEGTHTNRANGGHESTALVSKDSASSTPTTEVETVVERAERLVAQGLVVIPVHSVGPDRKTCSCPRGAKCGKNAGKHPIGDDWQHHTAESGLAAVRDLATKRASRNLGAPNLGILPEPSGLVIIDCDPRNKGNETMAAHKAKGRKLPRTKANRTGSGGWHATYHARPGVSWKPTLGPGVDIKHNGMVVAEGSVSHAGPYSVLVDAPIADLPDWVLEVGSKPATTSRSAVSTDALEAQLEADPDLRRGLIAWLPKDGNRDDLRPVATMAPDARDANGHSWEVSNGAGLVADLACRAHQLDATARACGQPEVYVDTFVEEFSAAGWSELADKKVRDNRAKAAEYGPALPKDWAAKVAGAKADAQLSKTSTTSVVKTGTVVEAVTSRNLHDLLGRRALEDANVADLFAATQSHLVNYAADIGTWHRYDGARWKATDVDEIRGMVKRLVQQLVTDTNERDGKTSEAIKLQRASRISGILTLAKGEPALRVDSSDFDQHPDKLNCVNGVVDLTTGDLGPHDPELLLTKIAAVAYDPDATSDDIGRVLDTHDEKTRRWVQTRLGSSLFGKPVDDHVVFFHGWGANGKSTLLDGCKGALGDHFAEVTERVLMSAHKGEHTTDMTDLKGARMAVLEELPEGVPSVRKLKALAGTNTMTARRMRQDNTTWAASHSLIVTTNHHPKITETDYATWRRLDLLTWRTRFVDTEAEIENPKVDRVADPRLRRRMRENKGTHKAVLAWLVAGAVAYHQQAEPAIERPEQVKADIRAWREKVDLLGIFLTEFFETADKTHCVPTGDLYDAFTAYARTHGHAEWSVETFTSRMEAHDWASSAGVEKVSKRVTNDPGTATRPQVSYRPGPVAVQYAEAQKVRIWQGMKWAEPATEEGVD